jgi:hypothetical protein
VKPPINQRIRSLAVDHAIDLTHYSNGEVRKMLALLRSVDADLSARLFVALESMSATRFTVQRLDQLLSNVNTLTAQIYTRAAEQLTGDLRQLAASEAAYQTRLLDSATPRGVLVSAPGVDQVFAAATAKPFQGRLMSEWFASLPVKRATRLRASIAMGFVEGKTVQEMVTAVRGTKAQGYKDGILQIDRREAEAVVRTAVAHVAAVARTETYAKNADLMAAEQWLSTLDSRTTPECQIRDRLMYTADEDHDPIGHKVPWLAGPGELHWGCRSTSVPVLRTEELLGIKLPPLQRASAAGPIGAETNYAQWLAAQPASRQDQILGQNRGALFRSGKLAFEKFFNNEGRLLTLDQLRASNEAAFKRAGLD